MRLEYDPSDLNRKPYWYAATDTGSYDAVGATPLDALASLAMVLERELEKTGLIATLVTGQEGP